MIKSLYIQNFQSHAKSELNFHPGVNIIVGFTDSGKTAIIRALRWLIWNKPSGSNYRSIWGGTTEVQLVTEEGLVIRSKDKVDKYILGVEGRKDIEFTAFGTTVPEEINSMLNINSINLQRQLDNIFLLSESPGTVAAHFNKVAKLDKIDTSLQKINSEIRNLTSTISHKESDITAHNTLLTEFNYLEKAEIDLEVLEGLDQQLTALQNKRERLMEVVCKYQEIATAIDVKSEILQYEKTVNNILNLKDEIEHEESLRDKLYNLWHDHSLIQDDIDLYEYTIKPEKIVLNLIALNKGIDSAVGQRASLFKLLSTYNNINGRMGSVKALQAKLQAKFDKEFPDICPLCGQTIKKDENRKRN